MHEQLKMIRDDMEMEFIDHDGKSERPGGAVLSLTLGKTAFFYLLDIKNMVSHRRPFYGLQQFNPFNTNECKFYVLKYLYV